MTSDFWRDKRVFLTGHTGFKGSWLSLWLQRLGANVMGYALPPPTIPSLFEEASVADGMTSLIGDVRDLKSLSEAMQRFQPDVVIHMAAQPLVRYSYANPVETYSTNVMGTVNLLEAVRSTSSVRSVVVVTTDKCYENREWAWGYREIDRMGGYDPYSNSKGCAELVCAAYRSSFFQAEHASAQCVALATARAGNVIGGGDWSEDRLVPDILKAFSEGRVARIRNPKAVRPWQHVLEPLRGYLVLAEGLFKNGSELASGWNFGPQDDDAKEVAWIVQRMSELWGGGVTWEVDPPPHVHEANYLRLDTAKARGSLDWKPVVGLSEALGMTVEWFRARMDGNVRDYTVGQIADYENLIKVR